MDIRIINKSGMDALQDHIRERGESVYIEETRKKRAMIPFRTFCDCGRKEDQLDCPYSKMNSSNKKCIYDLAGTCALSEKNEDLIIRSTKKENLPLLIGTIITEEGVRLLEENIRRGTIPDLSWLPSPNPLQL